MFPSITAEQVDRIAVALRASQAAVRPLVVTMGTTEAR